MEKQTIRPAQRVGAVVLSTFMAFVPARSFIRKMRISYSGSFSKEVILTKQPEGPAYVNGKLVSEPLPIDRINYVPETEDKNKVKIKTDERRQPNNKKRKLFG